MVEQLQNEGAAGIQILQDSDSLIALLYADDVINLADTVRNLQFQLDILSRFCILSGMKMFVHYTFSSVWVAEWPPFGK